MPRDPSRSLLLAGVHVLVVDEGEDFRGLVSAMLGGQGAITATAGSATEGMALLTADPSIEVVVCDLAMKGAPGLELVRSLANDERDRVTIAITGDNDLGLAERILELGAYGYMTKPFGAIDLIVSVRGALHRRALEREKRAAWTLSVGELELETVRRLSAAAEYRDEDTGAHVIRMSEYTGIIARNLGFTEERIELLRAAAPMHDVGKIGVPDAVLQKPGPLSVEERLVMQEHASIGFEMLAASEARLLQLGALLALTHHERFDGAGYPRGLDGTAIPIEGRIAAVADVFDALTSDRCYRRAMPLDAALELMRSGRGSQFDPVVLDAFLDSLPQILAAREQHADTRSAPRAA